ncbi:uncharacterized protein LOC107009975 [Solanum pennellii]|uniref:Uncharacterized protein LOC107009975 n=1 Tax=Solanum pennellii TaxID=28526 RepID=A0ABM1G1S3_SOLPN|nr:uncharacterized protein LOC107009975 [Solanum pennellii]
MNNKILKNEYKVEESNKPMTISKFIRWRDGVLAIAAENGSHCMTVAELEETNVAFVSMDTTGVISDTSKKHVEVDQVYKDKSILKAVMRKYAIAKRAVVVVDGSHLKGPYNGTFVAASTTDGLGHIFPLVYGIIDSENDTAWIWFFEQLKEAYGERSNMCAVSDRNKSITKAVTNLYHNVPHYACVVPSTEYVHNLNDDGRYYVVSLKKKKLTPVGDFSMRKYLVNIIGLY